MKQNITKADGRTLYSMNDKGDLNFEIYAMIPELPSCMVPQASRCFILSSTFEWLDENSKSKKCISVCSLNR